MNLKTSKFSAWFVLALLPILLVGCKSSAIVSLPSGRTITASNDAGSLTINRDKSGQTATVTSDGQTVTVEPARILVDGEAVASIAESARKIDLQFSGDSVKISVDGQVVHQGT